MHRNALLDKFFRLLWSSLAAGLAMAPSADAAPTGGQITQGAGTINQAGTSTTITQSSPNLSLQWTSFDTSASETVHFVQPSAAALAVNRITDTAATRFFGMLKANGQVWLINPNGVLFGAGAQVNVGGLVASTLDSDDPAPNSAAHRFHGDGLGSIVNQGVITTPEGGYIAFLGKRVTNQGAISAPFGRVALGAGSDLTLSFAGNTLLGLQVRQSTLDNLAENGGLIRASGGAVVLSAGAHDAVLASVINNTGVIEAHSVRAVNGTIVLDGGQNSTASNSGMLDASGRQAGETGGTVKVLGQHIDLASTSAIDVTGDAGGGSVLVGGNVAGSGPERNAHDTSVAAGATLLADAVSAGRGGLVVVWSDGTTRFDGRIRARGGATGGDGGQVETSGTTLSVGAGARVDTLAPQGKAGNWLLDPQDLTIGGFTPNDGDITGQQITQALTTSNVTIQTGPTVTCSGINVCSGGQAGNGDIILANGALIGFTSSIEGNYVWSGNTTLTLSAYRNVELRGTANLDASGGTGNMVLRADNTGTGNGSVILGGDSGIYGNGIGFLRIYYNPTSYATPTDYAALMDNSNSYPLIQFANLNTYMLVNLAATVANKTYDGTTTATLSAPPVPRIALPSGVTVDSSGAVASFLDKNAGANKATSISGVVLSGANASQYALNGLDAGSASIDRASLAVTGVSASSKTYDATTAATLSGAAAVSAIGADAVTVAGTGAAAFANKNAGVGKAVTVTGYTLAGPDAGNYNLVQPVGLTATINAANLAVSGVAAANKAYDGSSAATLTGNATVSAFGSDVVNVQGVGSAVFADKNAGTAKAVSVTGYTLGGADAGNYLINQPSGVTATISQASLAITGLSAADKVYDGTSAATLTGVATVTPIGADVVTVTGSGGGSFADRNAGSGKPVAVTGYTLSGSDAGNYLVGQPVGLSATISQASLALSGISANNKTYDGSASATLGGSVSVAPFGSDVVTVAGTGLGSFADKNVGSGKAVTVTGFTLAGVDAGNYSLAPPVGLVADIERASLTITGVTGMDKTYDGAIAAMLGGSTAVAAFGSDVVAVQGPGTGVFADRNAGTGKAVSVSGFSLTGADAGNYHLLQPGGITATIYPATLAIGGLGAADKVYDGTVAASLSGTASVTAFGADQVNVIGAGSASFADKNAGVGKLVTVSGYTLTGTDAANYSVAQPASLRATVYPAALTVSGVRAADKTYDGSTDATLGGTARVSAFGSDTVSVAGPGSATFADRMAGASKPVSASGYTLSGPDAANYLLLQPAGLYATISPAPLAIDGLVATGKVYDGGVAATLSGNATVTPFGADLVTLSGPGSAVFADKNVGLNKTVEVSGFTLGGLDAGNYALIAPAGVRANITRAPLTVSGVTATDKVYDGNSAATLSGSAVVTPFATDAVTLGGTALAAFADKNVGASKPVQVRGYLLTGVDAFNYDVVAPSSLRAAITPAPLLVGGIGASDKLFDGGTAATVSTAGLTLDGKLAADSLTVTSTGTFIDASAGVGKTVKLTNVYGGADVANYAIVDQATTLASIVPLAQAPVTPVLRDAIVQVQSIIQAPQARAQPQALQLSSTVSDAGTGTGAGPGPAAQDQDAQPARSALIDTRFGVGPGAAVLHIQDGGVQMPPLANAIAE